jgi:hypothetical protein
MTFFFCPFIRYWNWRSISHGSMKDAQN